MEAAPRFESDTGRSQLEQRRLWSGPMFQKPQVRGHVGPLTSTFVEYVFLIGRCQLQLLQPMSGGVGKVNDSRIG
jgi:hypothetical protein